MSTRIIGFMYFGQHVEEWGLKKVEQVIVYVVVSVTVCQESVNFLCCGFGMIGVLQLIVF